MKIIISPTKQMVIEQDSFVAESQPLYLDEAKEILNTLKSLAYEDIKALWKCNEALASKNYEHLHQMDLNQLLSPAIMSYKGLQFQYICPDLFTQAELAYVKENLRILSGFYGILRPFDGISPYRLEMQAPLAIHPHATLYQFWGHKLYDALPFNEEPVINLASKEYTKTIRPFLKPGDQLIDIVFASCVDGKLKVKATPAKMARGQMVRFMAEQQVNSLADLIQFDHPHYRYSSSHSDATQLVFIHQNTPSLNGSHR